MSKNKKDEVVEADTLEVVYFKSDYKNLAVAGTNIVFVNGLYKTDIPEEIELLRNNKLVLEVGE